MEWYKFGPYYWRGAEKYENPHDFFHESFTNELAIVHKLYISYTHFCSFIFQAIQAFDELPIMALKG